MSAETLLFHPDGTVQCECGNQVTLGDDDMPFIIADLMCNECGREYTLDVTEADYE